MQGKGIVNSISLKEGPEIFKKQAMEILAEMKKNSGVPIPIAMTPPIMGTLMKLTSLDLALLVSLGAIKRAIRLAWLWKEFLPKLLLLKILPIKQCGQ